MLLTIIPSINKNTCVEDTKGGTFWKSEIRRTSHNNTEGAEVQYSTSN